MIRNSLTPARDRRTSALFQKLRRMIRRVSSEPAAEDVHQLRTTVRRVETLLAAREKSFHVDHKLLKQLARLRRRAGKVRDLDVQIVALREIRLEAAGVDKVCVLRHLQKVHKKRTKRLVAAAIEELADGLLARIRRTVSALLLQPQPAILQKDFAAVALDDFAKLARTQATLDEGNLHGFRMACKRVRYLAEMSETLVAHRAVAALKRIQDAIGEWHDRVTLTETAEAVLPNPHSPLLAALRTRRRSKFIHALRIVAEARRALLELRREVRRARRAEAANATPVAVRSRASTAAG